MACGRSLLILFAALAAAPAADAPPGIPAACLEQHGRIDNQACAAAAAPGSRESRIAYNNLALIAGLRGDYAAAARYYDQAEPSGGQTLPWGASVRTRRAFVYDRIGREQAAAAEAHIAQLLLRGPGGQDSVASEPTTLAEKTAQAERWAVILPIMRRASDPDFPAALAAYQALPAKDWEGLYTRAVVLSELGDPDGAVVALHEMLRLGGETYGTLNNACFILAKAGHAADALHYCYRAVQMLPKVALAHDSWATALAALGRCPEAQAQRDEARKLDPASVVYQQPLACQPQ